MTPLARAIVNAHRAIIQEQASFTELWAALYFALGRAAQASEAGSPDVRIWLDQAADQEYALLGDCERVGAVLSTLDGERS